MKSRGYSVVELLIASVLLIAGVSFGLKVYLSATKVQTEKFVKLRVANSLNLFSGHLQKNMASGDVRFFAFTGNSAAGDRSLGRFLIPLAGYCADLNANDCPNDAAIIYADYNKTTAPSVAVICSLTTEDANTLLVDTQNLTFGKVSTVGAKSFSVNGGGTVYPSGVIELGANRSIALLSPPTASMWRSLGAVVQLSVSGSIPVGTPVVYNGTKTLPPECVSQLQVVAGKYDVTGLYTVKVAPWLMKQFTAGTDSGVTDAERLSARGEYPLRLFQVQVRSLGRIPTLVAGKKSGSFVLLDCANSVTGLSCDGTKSVLEVVGTTQNRLILNFALDLYGAGGTALTATDFQPAAGAGSASCISPKCQVLAWKLPLQVLGPDLLGSPYAETFEKLNGSSFSLQKMESMKRLEFTLVEDSGKESHFNVLF